MLLMHVVVHTKLIIFKVHVKRLNLIVVSFGESFVTPKEWVYTAKSSAYSRNSFYLAI